MAFWTTRGRGAAYCTSCYQAEAGRARAAAQDALSDELNMALKHYQYHYPNYPVPEVYAWTSDFQSAEPILITDSVAFIFLEHYLGVENEYYSKMPKYMGAVKSTEYMIPDFVSELSNRFVRKKIQDNSLINEMIYQGKLLYFADALMPNNVWDETIPLKNVYHSSDYGKVSAARVDAIIAKAVEDGIDIAEEQGKNSGYDMGVDNDLDAE